MVNRNYVKGRNFEYAGMRYLRKRGYYCMRAYASKGLFDVIAIPPAVKLDNKWYNFPLGIQCKYNGQVPKDEREKLLKSANKWQMNIVIAWSDQKTHRFRVRGLDGIEWCIGALRMDVKK